jgi:predicted nucleic acid-binding protein
VDRVRSLLDTNILVDYLAGIEAARDELTRSSDPIISIVSWMEVQVGARNDDELGALRRFLLRFQVAELSRKIATVAVAIRRQRRIRLPDAIIWATAEVHGCLLVTRNTRDFPEDDPGVRVPYRI